MHRFAAARARLLGAYASTVVDRRTWVVAGAVAVVATAIAVLRIEPGTRSQLWAEDGWIFLEERYRGAGGPLDPYRGYAHLVPRVVAWVVQSTVPLQDVGLAMNVAGATIVGLMTAIVWVGARTRVGVVPAAIATASVALLPIGSMELAGNVSNSHWYLMAGSFWVLVSRPAGVVWTIVGSVVLAATAMSDPLSASLLAAALPRLAGGTRGARVQSLALLLGLAVQALVVLSTTRDGGDTSPRDPREILGIYIVRVGFGTLVGGEPGDAVAIALGPTLSAALGGVVLASAFAAALAVRRSTLLPLIALVTSLGLWFVMHWVVWPSTIAQPQFPVTWGARYSTNPLLLVAAAAVLSLEVGMRRAATRARRVALACAVGIVLLGSSIPAFQSSAPRDPSADLATAVDEALETCRTAAPDTIVALPVDPSLYALDVACADILEHASDPAGAR